MLAALAVFLAVLVATGLATAETPRARPQAAAEGYVGHAVCASCHGAQGQSWTGSQHQRAMQVAGPATVLGNFAGATFTYNGVTSRFYRDGERFLVDTDAADGTLRTFEVAYTFGVYPLQQYLVAFPDGRMQALSIAWDARRTEEGGQRWFHLYPDGTVGHSDPLHWTRPAQNWNYMCADCHSTAVRTGYDAAADRFATSWAELSVGCEACHGPGARHVAWAGAAPDSAPRRDPLKGFAVRFDDRRDVVWQMDPATGTARREAPRALRKEVETCGLCHARRGTLAERWWPGGPLSGTHAVSLLEPGLFEADGQMLDEVYTYQTFRQSRMFAAGVTCSDCHEPHRLGLRADGSAVCAQCHDPARFDRPAHTGHASKAGAPDCISCHMPQKTYMVVDVRHDHGFRIPRPDLTAALGTSNTCTACHVDRSPAWAAAAIDRWHGPQRKGLQTWAPALLAARNGGADAAARLLAVIRDANAPAIARATALADLAPQLTAAMADDVRRALADSDPLVRIGALRSLQALPATPRLRMAAPLLVDPVLGVRLEAAVLLADIPATQLAPAQREQLDRAAAAYEASQRLHADRAEARSNLAVFLARRGRLADAEAELIRALQLEPAYAIAAVNLADLYRSQGRDNDAEAVVRRALQSMPRDAGLHHVLGLALVRLQRRDEGLASLRTAAELDPAVARYAYVYAIALDSAGRRAEAIDILAGSLARFPDDREILTALVTLHRDRDEPALALAYAERLLAIAPATPGLAGLVDDLRRRAGAAPR